jgi:hypothetical protein
MSSLIDSLRFWRIISLILALAFLVLLYQSSQKGRYCFIPGLSCIMDTRTGHMYRLLNEQGDQELTPVIPIK